MDIVSIQLIESNQPKYMQLFNGIKESITSGALKPGDKLPAIRSLAEQLNVNTVTVVNAYKLLEGNNYITAKKGSGYYVSKDIADNKEFMFSGDIGITKDSSIINFASATPHPSIFPTDSFKGCINEVLERDKGFAFGYQESNGYRPLRQAILNYLAKKYRINTGSEDYIQIVSGAQQGIDLISKVLLKPGDYVITETPTYDGAVAVFKSRGARIVGVNLENDGIDVIDLEKKIRICKPKLIYVMSRFQNPTTICYSTEKLKKLYELAEKYNAYIVEDDSMSELCYKELSSTTLKAMDKNNSRVIYIKSFSKLLMPGLRIGCLVVPEQLIGEFTTIKHTSDISSSGLIQRSLDVFFRNGKWNEHIKYMREIYMGKYEFMLNLLCNMEQYGVKFSKPDGGLYFWIRLPNKISSRELYLECKRNGLLFIPSYIFYENIHKNSDTFIRLSFASTGIDQIREGMIMFETCLNNHL